MRKVFSTLALLVILSVSALAGQIGMTKPCSPDQQKEASCIVPLEGQIGMTGAQQSDQNVCCEPPADGKSSVTNFIEAMDIFGIAALLLRS